MVSWKIVAGAALTVVAVLIPAMAASANTPPNTYTPAGSSWVDVPVAQRVYLESFGQNYDDTAIFEVPAGITCTHNAVTATGPFLTAANLTSAECVDASSNPYNPIDTATRTGSLPFGFPINFYGTTYTSAYPNTNGGIFFDQPDSDYDESLAYLASNSQSSAMFPLGADLYYHHSESNFWTAQTTVGGAPAVVFSWEKFHNCCNGSPSADDITFQLVLIDRGSGNFDGWFNFSALANFDQGYDAPVALVNLKDGVTAGSNVLTAQKVTNVPTACTEGYSDVLGTPTDTTFTDALSAFYFKLEDATAQTVSVWSDSACTLPINVGQQQDEATDQKAYVQIVDDSSTAFSSIASGWSTFNPTSHAVDATELLLNIPSTDLVNGAADPLINRSLNTTVAGRFVIGQRGGVTVTDPATLEPAAAPTLAATGSTDAIWLGVLALLLLLGGGTILAARRARPAHRAR